jgi:hypothetical protein
MLLRVANGVCRYKQPRRHPEHIVEKSARTASLVVSCPRHKGRDDVQRVSQVYADAASALLSPSPVLKSADRLAWAGTICGVAGAVLLWIRAAVGGAASGFLLAAAVIAFAYALACYGWAAARRSRLVRVRQGMPRALAVWQAAWYCRRCDGVFFAPGTAPEGVSPGKLMSPAEFQHLVWTAGGYVAHGAAATDHEVPRPRGSA